MSGTFLAERGWVPDALIRIGIRRLVRQRLSEERAQDAGTKASRLDALRGSDIALHTDLANEQHYEVAADFFRLVLGPRLKYSASIYPNEGATLAEAEEHTLALYAERLGLKDDDVLLDLGCGWGSFSLWAAERFPGLRITSVSNSFGQREFIQTQARLRGLTNIEVVTADVNTLELEDNRFTKVISVEMFEHVRNYEQLMRRLSQWMQPGGVLLTHVFCHRELLYPFETDGKGDWMARHFFTGGLMPSADTLPQFQEHLTLDEQWLHSGQHYERTSRHWLENLDANSERVEDALLGTYPVSTVRLWRQRWRMFFMACEEMFAYDEGQQWMVAHYRFLN